MYNIALRNLGLALSSVLPVYMPVLCILYIWLSQTISNTNDSRICISSNWRQIYTQILDVWGNVVLSLGVSTSGVVLCTTKMTLKLGYIKHKRRVRKIINHHIAKGKREYHPRVHDLQHPQLGKPHIRFQIMDTRMAFSCSFCSVVIDSINLQIIQFSNFVVIAFIV